MQQPPRPTQQQGPQLDRCQYLLQPQPQQTPASFQGGEQTRPPTDTAGSGLPIPAAPKAVAAGQTSLPLDPSTLPGGEPSDTLQAKAPKPPLAPGTKISTSPGGELSSHALAADQQNEQDQADQQQEQTVTEEEEADDGEMGEQTDSEQGDKTKDKGEEQPDTPETDKDPLTQTLECVTIATQDAKEWAERHASALEELAHATATLEEAATKLNNVKSVLITAQSMDSADTVITKLENEEMLAAWEHKGAELQTRVAQAKVDLAALRTAAVLQQATDMQKIADELIANASKPAITTPPTTVPPAIDPIVTGPSIFVGLTTQPRPGTQLSPKSPFMNTSAPINFKYCALEKYVAEHPAHAYIANDVMPDLRTVLNWLKTLKGMHIATTRTRKECTIPHDAQSVGVMLQWLIQLRKSIGNIGRAQAAKEGTLPPMDAIHTDDEEPQTSHKSHSKTASRSQGQDGSSRKSTTLLRLEQSKIVSMANSKADTQGEVGSSKLTISRYTAAPPDTPLFAQYISNQDNTAMNAQLILMERNKKDILSFIKDTISADSTMHTTATRVYKDKQDMTETEPVTGEVNEAIKLLQEYPIGSYTPEEAYRVHKVANLFLPDATIPRLTTLVLTKMVHRDFGKTHEQTKRVKERHMKTLSTLLVLINQHVAFRKNRYKVAERTYIGTRFEQPKQPIKGPPPPPPKQDQALAINTGQQLQLPGPPEPAPHKIPGTNKEYVVQTPGTGTPPGFKRGGRIESDEKLVTYAAKRLVGPGHGYNTPNPTPAQLDYGKINHHQSQPPQPSPRAGIGSQNVRHNKQSSQMGHTEVPEFPADKRGKFEFYGNASERWPAYAHHFQYQPESANILHHYDKLEGADQSFRTRSVVWSDRDKLDIDKEFPQWEKNVFHEKLASEPNIMNHSYTYATALWSGMSTSVKEAIELNVDKTAGDHAMPAAMFMADLWKRTGALEWLQFNLCKLCRCHQDNRKQKSLKILTNATVTPSGDNVAKVLNEIMTAGDIVCGEGGDKYPYIMAVQQIVRSLQYCKVNDAHKDIKTRQVEVTYDNANGEESKKWVPFDITNEWDEQTDRLPTGEIDWKGRWTDSKRMARSIVSSITSSIKQDPDAGRYYPVFIKDWDPVEPIGMVKGAGPQPAGHIHDYHRRGKTDHKRTRSIYEQSRSRSADSRPHTSGYESDRSQLSEYSRYKREEKDRRDFYKRKEDYKKDKYKRESSYKPRATFDNTAPPSLQEQKEWYNKRGTCLFCGERKHHTKFSECPTRNKYHRDWVPDWEALKNKPRADAYSLETRAATPSKSPNKYAHMNQGERGRTPTRDPSRDPNRDRTRSAEPGRSPHRPLPGPPPGQAPRQINL
jgi:hypothetical protein